MLSQLGSRCALPLTGLRLVLTLFPADNGFPRSHFSVIFVAGVGAVQVMGESRA